MPIYKHNYYKKGFNNKKFTASETYYRNCISIPMYAGLTVKNQNKVIKLLKDILN
jgi:dTDP-4-amino-4,6-dideoxygalactose transaminase